jgi:hypothetical protein
MVVALVPGEPGDADRFPFLPESLGRVAKKSGTDAAYRASRRYVFNLVSRERITTNGTVLGSAPAMRRRLRLLNRGGLFGITHRT